MAYRRALIFDSGSIKEISTTDALTEGAAPTHRWRMDETSGTALADSGTATASGLTLSGAGAVLNAEDVPSYTGITTHSVEMATNAKAVSGSQPSGLATYGFCMCFWWKPVVAGANGVIGGYGHTSSGIELQHLGSPNQDKISVIANAATNLGLSAALGPGVWRRLCVWFPPSGSANTPILFVNGAFSLVGSSATITANASDHMVLGCDTSASGANFVPQTRYSRLNTVPCTTSGQVAHVAAADYAGHLGVISP